MRKIIGILVLLLGVCVVVFGIYFDFAIFFIGGILDMIHGIKANPTNDHQVVWGAFKFFILGGGIAAVGGFIAFLCWVLGFAVMGSGSSRTGRLMKR